MADETKKPKDPAKISDAIKDKYKMKAGFAPGEYRFRGENINTSTCSLEEIEALVTNGFDVVEPVAKAATPAK